MAYHIEDSEIPGLNALSMLFVLISMNLDTITKIVGIVVGASLVFLNIAKFIKVVLEKDNAGKNLVQLIKEFKKAWSKKQ
jgi:hypothetical protein